MLVGACVLACGCPDGASAAPPRTVVGQTVSAPPAGPTGSAPRRGTPAVRRPTGPYAYPLKVGPTGRYLVDQNGKPFLLVGDAAWSLVAQLTDADADAYLADRQRLGFTAVLVNLIEHEFSTNAPADIYGLKPFARKAFTTPNEAYFAHADHIIQSAAQKGILVLLAPAYLGFGCGDQGWCAEMQAASLAQMRAWGRYVGRRYGRFDNIVWVIGGDADPSPVKGKVLAVVGGIRSVDSRHLFTAHNARGTMAIVPWSGAAWLVVNDIYTGGLEYVHAESAYAVSPARPFFLVEAYYENERGTSAQSLRAQSYWTVLSGGFGHVFGNCPIWSFGAPAAARVCPATDWRAEQHAQGSLNMSFFQALFGGRHWYSLVPDVTHIALTAGYGTPGEKDYATAAYAADGSSIIAYLPSSRAVTVSGRRLAGARMTAWWYDPGTGVATRIGSYPTSGTRVFTPPGSGDWVLVVDSQRSGFASPGR
jgi:hypothetical protein